jgi:hypothetical protein
MQKGNLADAEAQAVSEALQARRAAFSAGRAVSIKACPWPSWARQMPEVA